LIHTGRTLIGAQPSLGQQTEKHYFGKMPSRVRDYLRDVQSELFKLGVSFNTLHNEVAPAQHEISPIFSLTNVASDQNTMAMEVLEAVALKHGLVCLMHEKPFAGLNGSGKHNNWGLNTDTGANLFVPGKTKHEQERFMVFIATLARALDVHGDVIRTGIVSAGNDHRLGAQEAPPAIISLYTGSLMEQHLKSIVNDGPLEGYGAKTETLDFQTNAIMNIEKNIEDRNRTAPFPFCGNRFEFRAVGSSQNIAWPLMLVNAAFTDSMSAMSDLIESGKSPKEAVKQTLKKHMRVIFNGNGYSSEWPIEAKKRGLWNLPQSVDAIGVFNSEKNQKLFESTKVFTKEELAARTDVLYENYIKAILCEVDCLLNMVSTGILAACATDLKTCDSSKSETLQLLFKEKDSLYASLYKENAKLKQMYEKFPSDADHATQAKYASNDLKTQMLEVRNICDKVELTLPADLYPFPKYENIFYDHHSE
jgi:glutamine synthetase